MKGCLFTPLVVAFVLSLAVALSLGMWVAPLIMAAFWALWWGYNRVLRRSAARPTRPHGYDQED